MSDVIVIKIKTVQRVVVWGSILFGAGIILYGVIGSCAQAKPYESVTSCYTIEGMILEAAEERAELDWHYDNKDISYARYDRESDRIKDKIYDLRQRGHELNCFWHQGL